MNDTIFGKIIRKEIPATIVYEDEQFLAFLDIDPVAKGHTLLIPKAQYTWIHEAPDEVISAIFIKAKELINAMRKGLPCDYVQMGVVGNEVPHFHIHLIPRHLNEVVTQTNRPHTPYENTEEMKNFAEKITAQITREII
jgi:histidine triad (HIT) family protein